MTRANRPELLALARGLFGNDIAALKEVNTSEEACKLLKKVRDTSENAGLVTRIRSFLAKHDN